MKPAIAPTRLVRDLQANARHSGNQLLERRLADLALWFNYHKGEVSLDNLASRVDFLERTLWVQLEINALLLERLRKREGGAAKLYLPTGMSDGERHYS